VRLGSGALWADREAYLAAGGMTAEASRWLAERRPLAVGADNVAWDLPGEHDPDLGSLPGHTILIVQEGIHIIESLYLEELAAEGVREFGFVCLPLKLRGGTGSPVRPVALV
jgi:kynurenine formamidase